MIVAKAFGDGALVNQLGSYSYSFQEVLGIDFGARPQPDDSSP